MIESFGPADRYYMGHFVAASDEGYADWMFKKDGHSVPGLYKMYANKGDDKDKKLGKEKVEHILKYRVLVTGQEPICLAPCKWLKAGKSTRVTGTIFDLLKALFPKRTEECPAEGHPGEPVSKKRRQHSAEVTVPGEKALLLPGAKQLPYSRVEVDLAGLRESFERDPEGQRHEERESTTPCKPQQHRDNDRGGHRHKSSGHREARREASATPLLEPEAPRGPKYCPPSRSASPARRRTPPPFRNQRRRSPSPLPRQHRGPPVNSFGGKVDKDSGERTDRTHKRKDKRAKSARAVGLPHRARFFA